MSSTPQNPSDDVPATADSTPEKPVQQPPTSSPFGASAGTLGQHAAPRPYPPAETTDAPVPARQFAASPPPPPASPPPSPAPSMPPMTPSAAPMASASEPAGPPVDAEPQRVQRELPEPPARRGFARHLLATVLGLVVTPFAVLLIGVGTSRLADIAGTNEMGTDMLGTTLLVIGLVMLAVLVLLGVWSPAVPVVGGLVWGIGLGVAYLSVPGAMEDAAQAMTSDGKIPVAIDQLAEAGMNGYLLVLGTLLVAAGLATSLARRRGRRWAERTAVAERARAQALADDLPDSQTGARIPR